MTLPLLSYILQILLPNLDCFRHLVGFYLSQGEQIENDCFYFIIVIRRYFGSGSHTPITRTLHVDGRFVVFSIGLSFSVLTYYSLNRISSLFACPCRAHCMGCVQWEIDMSIFFLSI